ncbi:MAG: acyloxyacyl hydrolase [Limisphaerales bacterium]
MARLHGFFTVKSKFELGYRLQPLSNAGLGQTHPGLNLHVFNLGHHLWSRRPGTRRHSDFRVSTRDRGGAGS